MHRTWTLLSSLVVVVSAAGALGCSSSTAASDGGGGGPPANVSFSKDVMPIFQAGCTVAGGTCHGAMNGSRENLYLGEMAGGVNTPAIITQVYTELVGAASLEDPAMSLVAKGDTSKSYLSHKLMGDQNNFASDCAKVTLCPDAPCTMATPCGTLMPFTGMMDTNRNATINDWITQGALNN